MQAWEQFLALQEAELGVDVVNQWLRPLKIISFDAGNLFLQAKDPFAADWFEEHIRKKAAAALINNNKRRIKIHLSIDEKALSASSHQPKKPRQNTKAPAAPTFTITFDDLDPYYTFSHFIEPETQALAYKLFQQISSSATSKQELGAFNPIYLHGSKGTGKSHLLMATAHALRELGLTVVYARAETFTEHMLGAIRAGEMGLFRQSYRNTDTLIIDGVQLFGKKWATQEELFHTFNALHIAGKQIILSASCPPSELQSIEPRLVSRFEWGIVLSLEQQPAEMRAKILQTKAAAHRYPIHAKIAEFLLETFVSSTSALISALEALIIRTHVHPTETKLSPSQLTVPIIRRYLADLIQNEQQTSVTPEKIIQQVVEHFGIPSADILGRAQSRDCVLPRQIAMFLCRSQLKLPYAGIGELFSKDHSTVMSSIKRIKSNLTNNDPEVASHLHAITKKLSANVDQ